jgi:hypothetical protein
VGGGGIGEDFVPGIADLSGVSEAFSITDEDSFATARELLKAEGLLGGSSTGTLLAAALRYCREQTEAKRVVTVVCDTGTRYLSKLYNDQWMLDQGLLTRPELGDLRDLISRRFDEGAVVSVGPADSLLTAFQRMRLPMCRSCRCSTAQGRRRIDEDRCSGYHDPALSVRRSKRDDDSARHFARARARPAAIDSRPRTRRSSSRTATGSMV